MNSAGLSSRFVASNGSMLEALARPHGLFRNTNVHLSVAIEYEYWIADCQLTESGRYDGPRVFLFHHEWRRHARLRNLFEHQDASFLPKGFQGFLQSGLTSIPGRPPGRRDVDEIDRLHASRH